jgi:gamma-glutamylcyclotransferase (GGCT)/AIG2-like uncharacterized protein YtfP
LRIRYFAYGSNLDARQLEKRCPGATGLFRARLPHHRLDFTYYSSHWVGGAADVLPHSNSQVWGAVYELDSSDLVLLDRFERGYERVVLRVFDDEEREHLVTSYTVREKRSFRPTDIYLDKMLRWGEHWHLPDEYLEALRRVPVQRARGLQRLP